jgi:hypothetical protein
MIWFLEIKVKQHFKKTIGHKGKKPSALLLIEEMGVYDSLRVRRLEQAGEDVSACASHPGTPWFTGASSTFKLDI